MTIMQMMFFSAGTLTETPFGQTTPGKPLTSVISFGSENLLSFAVPAGVSNISVQAWGAGGASGSTVNGISGAGGGGGYVSAVIPVSQLSIGSLIVKVGGGGGNPDYFASPSAEYGSINRSSISLVGSNSVSSNPTYSTVTPVGTPVSSVSTPTYNTVTHVASVSDTGVTSLTIPAGTLQVGDVILVASVSATTDVNNDLPQNVPNTPTGYAPLRSGNSLSNVNYKLSYKRVTDVLADADILNLSDVTADQNPTQFTVAHTASIFRNVFGNPITSLFTSTATSTSIDPPSIVTETPNYMSVAFGFHNDRSITPTGIPAGYTQTVVQAVGTNANANDEATIMVAHRSLPTSAPVTAPENPGPFTVPNAETYVAITVGLMPTKTLSSIPGTLALPTGTAENDIVLVASVSDGGTAADGGTMNLPTGYTVISQSAVGDSPAYCLSYRRIIVGDTQISNLSTVGQIVGGQAAGQPAGVAHVAMTFRGAALTGNPIITNTTPASTGTGNPDPPSINTNTVNFTSVAFGFLNNISATTVTPPANYTTNINQPVGSDTTGTTEASLMSAYRLLTTSGTENPATFGASAGGNNFAAVTVGLRPQLQAITNTSTLTLSGLQENDIVLLSSISDGGTMVSPAGYAPLLSGSNNNQPAYQLSWRRLLAADLSAGTLTINGLTTQGVVQGGNNNGDPAGVAHVVMAFRGASLTVNPRIPTPNSINTGNGAPNSPSISGLIDGDTVVSFGFLDNISVTANSPTNYTTVRNQAVGTDSGGDDEATIMSAYRILNTTTGTEDPPAFQSASDDYVATTVVLTTNTNNKFSSTTGACGGSGGGFSGVFYNAAGILTPLLIAGGGGGGGGATVASQLPAGIAAGTPTGGNGGPGGGLPGLNGNAFVLNALSQYFYAGQGGTGGGDDVITFGVGLGGATYYFNGISALVANLTNPGENGATWNDAVVAGFSTGSRGANSPSNDTTTIPLYGANATGGWIRGAGGGSSRTSSTSIPVSIPSDCGGAGGSGYHGGGGGGSGAGGGGGGGGGGSNYVSPDIFVNANIAGIGTVPGNSFLDALGNIDFTVGYGGDSVTGSGINVQGNAGRNGLVIISYIG